MPLQLTRGSLGRDQRRSVYRFAVPAAALIDRSGTDCCEPGSADYGGASVALCRRTSYLPKPFASLALTARALRRAVF